MAIRTGWVRTTFDTPRDERDQLFDYAESQGLAIGECVRRILAAYFALDFHFDGWRKKIETVQKDQP